MVILTMKFVSLALVFCCAATVVYSQRAPDIRRISITELLENNPALKAELAAKIKANKNEPSTTKAPATTTPATTTTASPAEQANTPPAETSESTTPVGDGKRPGGNGRRNGGVRRRRPVVSESTKFSDDKPPHRLRVVKDETSEAPVRQNGRRFPGSN